MTWYNQIMTAGASARTRGTCESFSCLDPDPAFAPVLLYDFEGLLLCAECYRPRAQARSRSYQQPCDTCGRAPAWRDPRTRKNEYLCQHCHVASGHVPLPPLAPRVSAPLTSRRETCEVSDRGTPCRGQVKPRGKAGTLCDFHFNPKAFR